MRKAQRSNRRKYLIAIVITAIVAGAVIAVVLASPYWWPRKPLATEYLDIALTRSIGHYATSDNQTISLRTLGIRVTPRLGDATMVLIEVSSHTSDDETNLAMNISKGIAFDFAITLENYVAHLESNNGSTGFPIEIQIGSMECQYQELTLYVKPEDILITP